MRTQDLVDHLEKIMVLEKVSQAGSIRRASEVLGISQPSLSIKIKTLESLLGVKIFQRSQSGIQTTNQGQIILDFVKQTYKNISDLKFSLEKKPGILNGHVRIGVYDSIARYLWPHLYKQLKIAYPEVSISLFTGRSSDIMTQLSTKEIDIAVTVDPQNDQNYFQKTLYSDSFSCYISPHLLKGNPHFKKKSGYSELQQSSIRQNMILFSQALTQYTKKLDNEKFQYHHVENFEIALQFCLEGIGLAILPHRVAQQELNKKRLTKVKLSTFFPVNSESHDIKISVIKQIRRQPTIAAIFEKIKDSNIKKL